MARPILECLDSVDSPAGRERLAAYLESQPFTHFEACPEKPGFLKRVDEDGTVTMGRFVSRTFTAADRPPKTRRRPTATKDLGI